MRLEAFEQGVKLVGHNRPVASPLIAGNQPRHWFGHNYLEGMRYALAVILCLHAGSACAVEVGDVIMLSTNGVGSTVTAHRQTGPGIHQLQAAVFTSNVAEYCQRYEQVQRGDKDWDRCMADNKSAEKLSLTVDCNHPTIVVDGDGAYRRQSGGGPWTSVADPNSIIHADHLYAQVCRRNR